MRAIILAAGRGSRLKNLTKNKPKSFLNIFGKSLITRQIKNLEDCGVKDIGVVVGYKGNKFRCLKKKIFKNDKWKVTNMVFSLFSAKDWLFNDDCIICYSDILFDKKVIKKLISSKTKILLPSYNGWKKNWEGRYENPLDDLETFKTNENNELTQIGERPRSFEQINGQFMGVIKFKKGILRQVYKFYKQLSLNTRKNIQMTKFLNLFIKSKKVKIKVFKTTSYWYEIDNQRDYSFAIKDIRKRKINLQI